MKRKKRKGFFILKRDSRDRVSAAEDPVGWASFILHAAPEREAVNNFERERERESGK